MKNDFDKNLAFYNINIFIITNNMKKQSFTRSQFHTFKKLFHIQEKESKYSNIYKEKTISYLKYIKWIPGIEMIGIWNSIAMGNASENSDIDLYIVTHEKMLWYVRIMTTLIFQILGVRKTEKKHDWRFCLSFFSTRKGMDFSKFCLQYDPYLYFWIITFIPIFDNNNCYKDFIIQNSTWANFDSYEDEINLHKQNITYQKHREWKDYSLLKIANSICFKIFQYKTKKHYEKLWKPYGIIINDTLLKFHNNDIRKKIAKNIKK